MTQITIQMLGQTLGQGAYVKHMSHGRVMVDADGQKLIGMPLDPDRAAIAQVQLFYADQPVDFDENCDRAECDFTEMDGLDLCVVLEELQKGRGELDRLLVTPRTPTAQDLALADLDRSINDVLAESDEVHRHFLAKLHEFRGAGLIYNKEVQNDG